jgi:hypothetical protein
MPGIYEDNYRGYVRGIYGPKGREKLWVFATVENEDKRG